MAIFQNKHLYTRGKMMAGQDEAKFTEIFDRLRETEAQTREQNERIANLCDRIDNFTNVTNKFFEIQDKQHQDGEKRFQMLCDHEQRMQDKAQDREDKMWKIIMILLGTVIASVFGPKAASEIYKTTTGKGFPATGYYMPMLPMNDHHLVCVGSREMLV